MSADPHEVSRFDGNRLDPHLDHEGIANDDDWPARASATIVNYVETVRDKTTGPALVASRYAVYVLAMVLIAFVLVILLFLLMVRVLVAATNELPFVDDGETWMAYYVLGGLFTLVGVVMWRRKEA